MGSADLGWRTTRAVDGRFKFNILQPDLCLRKGSGKRGRSEKRGAGELTHVGLDERVTHDGCACGDEERQGREDLQADELEGVSELLARGGEFVVVVRGWHGALRSDRGGDGRVRRTRTGSRGRRPSRLAVIAASNTDLHKRKYITPTSPPRPHAPVVVRARRSRARGARREVISRYSMVGRGGERGDWYLCYSSSQKRPKQARRGVSPSTSAD